MNNSRRFVFPALISAGVLWGTTVPLSKVALAWLPPASLAFIRFALAAALLMLVSRSRLRAAFSPAILVTGALGYGGSVVLQNFGVERTSVTHAALLIGATPVLVAIIAGVCGHSVARPAAWAGFALSLAGVGVIAAGRGGGASMGGDALVLAGQFASAGFTVSQARLLRGRDPVAVTALQLMAAAVVTLPLALMTGGVHTGPVSPTAVLATGALVLFGTVAPTTLFAVAQSRVPADVAGAFLNLEPLVGAAAGTVLFANPLGVVQLGGGVAILAGIGLSSLPAIRANRAPLAPAGTQALDIPAGVSGTGPVPGPAGVGAAVAAAGTAIPSVRSVAPGGPGVGLPAIGAREAARQAALAAPREPGASPPGGRRADMPHPGRRAVRSAGRRPAPGSAARRSAAPGSPAPRFGAPRSAARRLASRRGQALAEARVRPPRRGQTRQPESHSRGRRTDRIRLTTSGAARYT
jgi:O-acetylserine/cysteine efflux transporter